MIITRKASLVERTHRIASGRSVTMEFWRIVTRVFGIPVYTKEIPR